MLQLCWCCTDQDEEVSVQGYHFQSVIPEESSRLTITSQNRSLTLKNQLKRYEGLSLLDAMSPVTELVTIRLQQFVLLKNKFTQLYLHSHCLRSNKTKQAHEVSLISNTEDHEYEKWVIKNDKNLSQISNGDVVTIQHKLTGYMLGAILSNFSKKYDICCVKHESDAIKWKIYISGDQVNNSMAQQGGCQIRLMHLQSQAYLTPFNLTAMIKPQIKVTLTSIRDFQGVWILIQSDH